MAVGIYQLTDQTGGKIVLFVPRFSGDTRKPNNTSIYTIASATRDFSEQFDHTATFFCNDQTSFNYMQAQGFTNIVYTPDHTGDVWTFENGGTIEFTATGARYRYSPTSSQPSSTFSIVSRSEHYNTFVSDHTNSWTGENIGYYGHINSVSDKGFTFYYYYPTNLLPESSMNDVWNGLTPFEPATDPYEDGGISGPGGGTGTFSATGDTIGIPSLPTLSAVDAGFVTLFNPGIGGLRSLSSYMWSDAFNLETFKKVVANPMDCILGLSIVPVDPPNAGSKEVKVGNISTGVTLPYISTQYVEVDCGTLEVQEFWGSYLDYSPYTKLSLYLPYIGIVPIDIDDVMNASIHVVYHIDVLSGAMVSYVLCNGTQLYTYIGQCSANIPITSNDYTNTINGILGIAGNIGSLVASGGASAPSDVPSMVGNAINALKPNVQKSGAMSGTGGMLGVQTPYLILQRPKQSVAGSQNTFTGYPSNITATLSDLSGYTEVDKIHLENVTCSDDELDEIRNLLDSGVII